MSVFYNMPANTSMPSFPELVGRANQAANQIVQHIASISGISQNDDLYNMILTKNIRNRKLKETIKTDYNKQIFITDHIFHAVTHKPINSKINFFNMQTAPEKFENSIIILGNNNVLVNNSLDKFISLYLNSPTSIFVIWDFDNHHWFSLSNILAACSDLFVPAHSDNLEVLSRYNNVMAGPIPCGIIQWSKDFLKENIDIVKNTERSDTPLGTHIEYPQFPLRQKNLKTLNLKLPNVKLVDGSYHSRDITDRFVEWCSHKSHWIVPVLNDAPIRIYDSLVTGGIPIVPRSIKYHKYIENLWDHVLFYDYWDIQNPEEITKRANDLFDSRGSKGVLDRHQLSCYNHHVDNRVETILEAVKNEFGIDI
jgi:hypothetical protein